MAREGWSVYSVGDAIRWVVDDDRVIVVDGAVPAAHVLTGQDAVLWRVMTASGGPRKLAGFLQLAQDLTEPAAEAQLRAALGRWAQLGIVSCAAGGGDG
jgi:hypothetical protein